MVWRTAYNDINYSRLGKDHSINYMYHTVIGFQISYCNHGIIDIYISIHELNSDTVPIQGGDHLSI